MSRAVCIGSQYSTNPLDDVKTYREGVATNVVGADGEIGDLQVLDAVDVESFIQDAVLDDIVALLGSHTTGTQRVPGGLAMSRHPLLNMCNVLKFSSALSAYNIDESHLTSFVYFSGSYVTCWLELTRLGMAGLPLSTGIVQLPC